jgi:ABC-2 type transport system ATP-binding protein
VTSGVRAEGLVKTFHVRRKPPVKALDGVSIEVAPGTVLGLLGPNGAGKTTVVNILTTLLRPDAGSATVAGFDVLKDPHQVRRHIGLAGQSAAVDERLTGRENLVMVGKLNQLTTVDARARAARLLSRFDLEGAADRQLNGYSGGMRRRLDLAVALVASPPVVFLDEPTTGLDPRSRQDLWGVIEELVADGTTLLLTTQYLEEADRLADRIAVVDGGHVIAEGTAAELKSRLGSTVVVIGTASVAASKRAVTALKALGEVTVTGLDVTVGIPSPTALAEVVRLLDGAKVTIASLVVREPSLDDVFLDLTGKPTAEAEEVA